MEQGLFFSFLLSNIQRKEMEHQPTREKLYSTSKGYGFSPALQRTRKPFAVRNLLTLAGLLTFTGSVCKFFLFVLDSDAFTHSFSRNNTRRILSYGCEAR